MKAIASCAAAPYNSFMTNTKEPSKHSRDLAAKLAADAEIWQAIDDAHRQSMPGAEDALARIVQLVRDEQISELAASLADDLDPTKEIVDDHPDFSIVGVDRCEVTGGGEFYQVTARLWGPVPGLADLSPIDDSRKTWGGMTSVWLGNLAVDGSLTCVGWGSADQWVDGRVDHEIGTAAAVELGQRILAAAEVRS